MILLVEYYQKKKKPVIKYNMSFYFKFKTERFIELNEVSFSIIEGFLSVCE